MELRDLEGSVEIRTWEQQLTARDTSKLRERKKDREG